MTTAVTREVPRMALQAEIEALPSSQRLADSGPLHVYYARAAQIRWGLQEIGRLRELTFRSVGEGTGRSADVDDFDADYLHLFVWDARTHAIAGAYRLGLADDIVARRGLRGLYTHSLFTYPRRLLDALNPAIELGRSFVRAEYQRSFAPLLLLWSGIGRFVEHAPRYAVLFGPVSISGRYTPASRRLIVDYLWRHRGERRLARHVRPRRPFRDRARASTCEPPPTTIDQLSRAVARLEPDGKSIPVLLRHYLRLGARVLGFSVDPDFADALDALMVVDLREIEPALLARYMGGSGSAAFRTYHRLEGASLTHDASSATVAASAAP